LWSDNYTHPIAPGQTMTVIVNMGDPGVVWNAVEGTHTVKAVVNGGNTIFESNTQNNSYSERMVITKPCDLIVTNIYLAPGDPIVGEPIKIKATIKKYRTRHKPGRSNP